MSESLLPKDAPIFRGIVCTDCGAEFDAARLVVIDDQATGERYFFCPKCGSSQIDFALWDLE